MQFVKNYCGGKNAEQAALAAGYAETTARKKGHSLLNRPAIREEIDAARVDVQKEARYELADAVRDADQLMEEARKAKQYTAASKILDTKLKLFGLLIERVHQLHTDIDLSAVLERARERIDYSPRRLVDITPSPVVPAAGIDIFT